MTDEITTIEDRHLGLQGAQQEEARVWRDLQDLRESGAQEGCTRLAATKASLRVKEALTALARAELALALLEREKCGAIQWVEYLQRREKALWAHD